MRHILPDLCKILGGIPWRPVFNVKWESRWRHMTGGEICKFWSGIVGRQNVNTHFDDQCKIFPTQSALTSSVIFPCDVITWRNICRTSKMTKLEHIRTNWGETQARFFYVLCLKSYVYNTKKYSAHFQWFNKILYSEVVSEALDMIIFIFIPSKSNIKWIFVLKGP